MINSVKPTVLIIDAPFYQDVVDELYKGATAVLQEAGVNYEHISVPGALEIPAALAMAIDKDGGKAYGGFVVLGCVIRGKTSHYEIVAGESARAVMDLSVSAQIAVGNGILTVENMEQAKERASVNKVNKGGWAASATLAMMELKQRMKHEAHGK